MIIEKKLILNNNSMSIDIETLDTKRTSIIVSVGCVVFNKNILIDDFNIEKTFNLDLKSQERLGRTIGVNTITWWMKYNSNNISVFNNQQNEIHELINLLYTLTSKYNVIEIWAKSPNFDLEILNNLFEQLNYEFPISYKKWMDVRTIINIREFLNLEEYPFKYNKHNAIDDAKYQAELIIDTYQYLKKLKIEH